MKRLVFVFAFLSVFFCHVVSADTLTDTSKDVSVASGSVQSGSLDELAGFMTGSFSSAEQAGADPENFKDIRLEIARIWPQRTDGIWLYVEQAASATLDKPYRQRVYHLETLPDGQYKSSIMEFKSEPLQYAGEWKSEEPLKTLGPDSLVLRKGGAVILTCDGAGKYAGGTIGKECESKLRGASYATTKVTIDKDGILSWDQGWDSNDKQVWGAEKGGYQFKKLSSPRATK
ncbi:MAG: chromophore lyase CpcT/CpeT [Candidatus Riflebacteria bacterium]|nr:chromophore lyase CpcT/CpeT [Candidatus Riflebacteria bacterium]